MYNVQAVLSLVLLYLLICGISASVDTRIFKSRIKSVKGIMAGLFSQFIMLPFFGFITVRIFDLDPTYGITLLAVTCSPGGAFSNWWCSLFNADLALSVAMTACSTIVSVLFMPLNLTIYIKSIYGTSVSLDWWGMIASIAVSLSGIVSGLLFSHFLPAWRKWFNVGGNVAGLALMIFGALTSSRDEPLWDKEIAFYFAVALPCVIGLMGAFAMSCLCRLDAPQRVAVSVESCYQNVGVALTIALATFDGKEASRAAGVPMYYGVIEIVVLPSFLLFAWKTGMTYAPAGEGLLTVILGNFQPAADAPQPVQPGSGPTVAVRTTHDSVVELNSSAGSDHTQCDDVSKVGGAFSEEATGGKAPRVSLPNSVESPSGMGNTLDAKGTKRANILPESVGRTQMQVVNAHNELQPRAPRDKE